MKLEFNKEIDNLDVDIDESKLINKFLESISDILILRFPDDAVKAEPPLKIISGGSVKYRFSCPYCGDSHIRSSKKRGNLHTSSIWYKCYNCQRSMPAVGLLYDFNQIRKFSNIEIEYFKNKSNLFDNDKTNAGVFQSNKDTIESINNIADYGFSRKEVMKSFFLREISQNPRIASYLEERQQYVNDMRHFACNSKYENIYFLNLAGDRETVIGMQARFSKPFNDMRFKSYNYSALESKIGNRDINDEMRAKFDKISLYYNILNINYGSSIFVLESSMNANNFIYNGYNAMATWSASSSIYLKHGLYLLDRDEAGKKKMIELISKGHKVFLWEMFADENPRYNDCSDSNNIFVKNPNISIPLLLKYFSDQDIDIFYI